MLSAVINAMEVAALMSFGDLLRHGVRLVHLVDDVLREIALAEFVDALQEQLLLVSQGEIHFSSLAMTLRARGAVLTGCIIRRVISTSDGQNLVFVQSLFDSLVTCFSVGEIE